MTPLKAIRAHCLECAQGRSGARECVVEDCPLYPYRLGHDPARAGKGGNPQLSRDFQNRQPSRVSAEGGTATATTRIPLLTDEQLLSVLAKRLKGDQ